MSKLTAYAVITNNSRTTSIEVEVKNAATNTAKTLTLKPSEMDMFDLMDLDDSIVVTPQYSHSYAIVKVHTTQSRPNCHDFDFINVLFNHSEGREQFELDGSETHEFKLDPEMNDHLVITGIPYEPAGFKRLRKKK